MNRVLAGIGLVAVLALGGCFDSSDNATKDNTDGTKSSVQMQQGKADETNK